MTLYAAAAVAIVGMCHNAHATVTFSVAGISTATTPSVSLLGSFTTNDARTSLVSFDIKVPASGAFAGFEYTTANSTISAVLPSQYFRLDAGDNELQFYFASGLGSTGGTLLTPNSYDHEPLGGNRLLSGAVTVATVPPPTATPEPLSLATLGTGLAAMVSLRRKRRV